MKEKLSGAGQRAFSVIAFPIIRAFARVVLGANVHVEGDRPKGGAIILCNHQTIFDFTCATCALRPRHVHFVARSTEFSKNKLYSWILNAVGIIPKTQGTMDLVSVRSMVKACRAGELVAIYPAGMTSFDGRPGWEPMSGTGSLVKMTGADVYAAVQNGGFLTHPRYTRRFYRGRVDLTLKKLYTAEEAKAFSADEIQKTIAKALTTNDWDWQEKNRVRFRGGKPLDCVSHLLYLCPSCRSVDTIAIKDKKLVCSHCGMTAARDKYGFFSAEKGACPRRMDEWVELELEAIRQSLADERFRLQDAAALYENEAPAASNAGEKGTLTLTKDALSFSGEKGEKSWSLKSFQFFILDDLGSMSIHTTDGAYRFQMTPAQTYRWFFTHRELVSACGPAHTK